MRKLTQEERELLTAVERDAWRSAKKSGKGAEPTCYESTIETGRQGLAISRALDSSVEL